MMKRSTFLNADSNNSCPNRIKNLLLFTLRNSNLAGEEEIINIYYIHQ